MNTCASEAACGFSLQSPQRIGGPIKHRNGNGFEDIRPPPPTWQLQQIIRTHNPDEAHVAMGGIQHLQRIGGVAGAEAGFDFAHANERMACNHARLGRAVLEGRHAPAWLQRILGRNKPPHLMKSEQFERQQADMAMALMGGIERAAKQTDPPVAMDGEGRVAMPENARVGTVQARVDPDGSSHRLKVHAAEGRSGPHLTRTAHDVFQAR